MFADLVELIRLHLDEKAALLDENSALRRLVADKLGEEELQSAVLPVSTASGLSADTVRATEDGVQRFMVLAAHAEIVRLKSESATAAAGAKAEADRLRAEMATLQADARRHSEEVGRLQARLAEQSGQLTALEALAAATEDGAAPSDAADEEQQQQADEERSGGEEGGDGEEGDAGSEAQPTDAAAQRQALRAGVVKARVAAAEGELQAARERGDAAEQRAEQAEQRALAAERTLESELAAAATRAEATLTSARAETAAELDGLRMAAATAQKAANDSAAALARALAAREAAETESARAQAALRASDTARANLSQQVSIAEQARRDEAATVVDLQRALAESHAAVQTATARCMWRLAGARVRQHAKWRAAVGAAAHAARSAPREDAAAADTQLQRAVVVRLRIVGDGPAPVTAAGDEQNEGGSAQLAQLRSACAAATAEAEDARQAVAAAEERLERLQAVVRQQRAELDGVQQTSTASADAVSKDAALKVQAAEQRAAAATAELQSEAARYKDKLRFFAEEVKRRDDAAKADAAVAADLRARMAAAEAAARSREEAAAASCAAREADLKDALHDAQRQANAASELRAHMAQLAHARDKAESELMSTSLRVAQLEGRVRLLDEGLTTARHALEREALTRERLEAQLADAQAGSDTTTAARDAERRAQAAEAAAAEAHAKLQEAEAEAQRLRDVLAAEDSDSPRLKQLRLRAEVAEEGVARLRREVAYVEEQCTEKVRQAEAQLHAAQHGCEDRLAAMRAEVAAAQAEVGRLGGECEALQHKLHTYRDEFTSWRERARSWMEAKDAELDAVAGRRGAAVAPTPAGPPLDLPQALGTAPPNGHGAVPSSPALQTPSRGSSPPSERRGGGRPRRVSETPSQRGERDTSVPPLSGDDERLTYLRNVLLKFLATSSWSTQQSLVPVLATLLRLTDGEKQQVEKARQQLAPAASSSITALLPLGLASPFR